LLGEAVERSQPYTHGSQRWKEITESITHFMAKEMIPIYTVEKPGFCRIVKKLDPRYELPSRKYFTKIALPSLYSDTCDKVGKELQEAEYYSLTTDLWSSPGKLKPVPCSYSALHQQGMGIEIPLFKHTFLTRGPHRSRCSSKHPGVVELKTNYLV